MAFAGKFFTEETEDTESLTLVKLKSCIDLRVSKKLRPQISDLETRNFRPRKLSPRNFGPLKK